LVLQIFKIYLNDSDPFVGFLAAKSLYTAGDTSGHDTLLALVTANDALPHGKQDLRVEAALTLAKYRVADAAGGIVALYSKTNYGDLLSALATLGVRAPQATQFPFVPSKSAITEYAIIGASEFISRIVVTFQGTSDPKVKNAAAWALARFGQNDYSNYLAEMSQAAIDANPRIGSTVDAHSAALRYLGSLQNPEARQVLESALDSNNPVAVQYATVNLLFNQPGDAEKALQVVAGELRGQQNKLGVELTLQIASQFADDPTIQAAGQVYQQRSDARSWQYYVVQRRNWPIYNWIDNYVVTLNRSPK
jgi:HEAT repeat protein